VEIVPGSRAVRQARVDRHAERVGDKVVEHPTN
jgi:hypothetical protein